MESQQPADRAARPAPQPISPTDPLLTPEAASAYLGGIPSWRTLERYRVLGTGPAFIRLARRIFYRQSALDAYLDKCERESSQGRGRAA